MAITSNTKKEYLLVLERLFIVEWCFDKLSNEEIRIIKIQDKPDEYLPESIGVLSTIIPIVLKWKT